MGLFQSVFGRWGKKTPTGGTWTTLTGYAPAFTSAGGELYEVALIRASIDAKARAISKLKIETRGTARAKLRSELRSGPNPWQTWSQYLYRLSTILDIKNTAFIVPILDDYGDPCGFFPILPTRVEVVQDAQSNPWLRFQFATGERAAMELQRVGIMTRYQYRDDLFGESNGALNPTMQLISMQEQGITEGIKNGATFRFMARVTNFTKSEDLTKERNRFNRNQLAEGAGGILLFPNTYSDIHQIDQKPYTVDADQMKLIQENVFSYFGTNLDVLENKCFGDAWNAFYEGALEPFAIQYSDVTTRMVYTKREIAAGNCFYATSNRLQYMSNKDKLQVSSQMADRGLMYVDEIRDMWNLPELPDGLGKRLPVRGEYYDASKPQASGKKEDPPKSKEEEDENAQTADS